MTKTLLFLSMFSSVLAFPREDLLKNIDTIPTDTSNTSPPDFKATAKYPKTSFKGEILNFDKSKLTANPQKYSVQGTLNFYNVDRTLLSPATIYSKRSKIYMKGSFVAKSADFKVTIPKMVMEKSA